MEMFVSLRGVLIISLMFLGVIATLIRPKVGIALILSVVILRAGFLYTWFSPIYEMRLPLIFLVFVSIAWLLHSRQNPLRLNLDIFLLVAFFMVICLSRYLFGTPIFDHHAPNDFLRSTVIFFLIVQLLRNPKDIKAILWVVVGIYLFLELRAYYLYKTEYMHIALPDYVWLNRNRFANSLAMVFPIAYILGRGTASKLLKILGYTTAFWCIVGVILTYSRSGFLALVVSIIGVMIFERKKTKFVVVIIILLVAILPRLSEKYIHRIQSIETYEQDASSMGRIATSYAAWNMLKRHPVFGVGAGNYNDLLIEYTPERYIQWVDQGKSVHNIILQAASETGLIGLFIFSLIILRGFTNTFVKIDMNDSDAQTRRDIAIMLRIALLSTFIASQFGQGAYYGNIYIILPFISAFNSNEKMLRRQKEGMVK